MEKEKCPKCNSSDFLEEKMILIGNRRSPEELIEREGGWPTHQLFADQIKEEYLKSGDLERFVDGLFCTKCGNGFIPLHILKDEVKANYLEHKKQLNGAAEMDYRFYFFPLHSIFPKG